MDYYVVYLRDRDLSRLGNKRKYIWKIANPPALDNIKLKNIVTGEVFFTSANNIVTIKELIKEGKFKPIFFDEDAFSTYEKIIRKEKEFLNDVINEYNIKFQEPAREEISNHKWDTSKYTKIKSKEITMGNKVKQVVDNNVDAAKVAASITAGKALNTIVADKVTPQLPLLVQGYAKTALGKVVLANVADFAVKQFMPTNEKANIAANAMMQAAMVELMDSFDFEKIVNEIVNSVELPVSE
jgi:hypothetical protein